MPDPGEEPDAAAVRAEERARITRALEALPEHHRAIIMLSDLEGLSYREIADVLNIPMGTVMSRLHNARKRLRTALGPLLLVLVAIGALLAPATAYAQQTVRFGARVLLATDTAPGASARFTPQPMDQRLEDFLPRLRQLFKYREYTSLERHRAQVAVGATERWVVPGDRLLERRQDRPKVDGRGRRPDRRRRCGRGTPGWQILPPGRASDAKPPPKMPGRKQGARVDATSRR